ncbi:MAG: GTP cyclohydrolase II [Candidatus Micrarchaeota archaeon]
MKLKIKFKKHKCEMPIKEVANAKLPTKFGMFRVYAFEDENGGNEHAVLAKGDVAGQENVPLRVHSECLTGDTFCSLKCDCGLQLQTAMEYIGKQDCGIIIYMRQEGRGIGFGNKIKAYALQDGGMDTVEANEALGLPIDKREYHQAAQILRYLKVKSVKLLTNNPIKIASLIACGIKVNSRIRLEPPANKYDENYLKIKKKKLGHMLKIP